MWWYAAAHPALLKPTYEPAFGRALTRQYLVGPIIYFVAVVLAFFSATASLLVCLLVLLFFAFPLRWNWHRSGG